MEGKVVFAELEGCDNRQIDSAEYMSEVMKRIAERCRLTILKTIAHRFEPHGVSIISMISESHVAMHSWPESGYLSVLIYSCGDTDPEEALPIVKNMFIHTEMRYRVLE